MPSTLPPRWLYRIRYGHAFPSLTSSEDPIAMLVGLICADEPIQAREPSDVAVVSDAESALGLRERPVYAYVGDLHPALGRVGLIISGAWYRRRPLGVSRCDSGGLIGLKGGFNCLAKDAAKKALLRLTMRRAPHWGILFRLELFMCHGRSGGWHSYLRGIPPQRPLRDDRDAFIRNMGPDKDRRLWTWEVRSQAPIRKQDVEAVALTVEAAKHVIAELRSHPHSLGKIRLVTGSATAVGVHHFDEESVVMAFMGMSNVQSTSAA